MFYCLPFFWYVWACTGNMLISFIIMFLVFFFNRLLLKITGMLFDFFLTLVHWSIPLFLIVHLFLKGILWKWPLGALLLAHRPPDYRWLQDVQISEKLHHHQGSSAKIFSTPDPPALLAARLERHTGLQRQDHGDSSGVRENNQRKFMLRQSGWEMGAKEGRARLDLMESTFGVLKIWCLELDQILMRYVTC